MKQSRLIPMYMQLKMNRIQQLQALKIMINQMETSKIYNRCNKVKVYQNKKAIGLSMQSNLPLFLVEIEPYSNENVPPNISFLILHRAKMRMFVVCQSCLMTYKERCIGIIYMWPHCPMRCINILLLVLYQEKIQL